MIFVDREKGIFPATYVRAGDSIEAIESEYDVVMVRLHHALDQWLIKLQNTVQVSHSLSIQLIILKGTKFLKVQ